jgi:hypothetical protein
VVIAAGLLLLACAHSLAFWFFGWTVIGVGMALGLYDAAFATIGTLLGQDAEPVIAGVTIIAGFASSIFWALGTFLIGFLQWRGLLAVFGRAGCAALLGWLALPSLLAQASAPVLTAPVVGVLPALDVLLLAGGAAGAAMLLLVPLRMPVQDA